MVKRTVIGILLVLVLSSFSFAGTYSGGTGEPNDPYQISTVQDLLNVNIDPNACYILINDIDLSGMIFETAVIAADVNNQGPYHNSYDGTSFKGFFDGNGYKIINLTINNNEASVSYLGLFGKIDIGGLVVNLGVESVNISGADFSLYIGGLVGFSGGIINNCYVTGRVSSGDESWGIGGLCGGRGRLLFSLQYNACKF